MSKPSTKTEQRDSLGMTPENWRRLRSMTDQEINAAAISDPDNPPLTPEQLEQMRRPRPVSKVIRNKLRMTRETFAKTYGIPIDTLRAWERRTAEPTPVEIAYLRLIEREPELAKITATDVQEKVA